MTLFHCSISLARVISTVFTLFPSEPWDAQNKRMRKRDLAGWSKANCILISPLSLWHFHICALQHSKLLSSFPFGLGFSLSLPRTFRVTHIILVAQFLLLGRVHTAYCKRQQFNSIRTIRIPRQQQQQQPKKMSRMLMFDVARVEKVYVRKRRDSVKDSSDS